MNDSCGARAVAVGAMVVAVVATVRIAPAVLAAPGQNQGPSFRGGIDLIQVDVQAVDKHGLPVTGLTTTDFSVSFNGHARKVVSADFLRYDTTSRTARGSTALPSVALGSVPPSRGGDVRPGRLIMIAVDALTFDVAASRNVAAAAQGFVDRLQPNDIVGLYSFPLGPKVEPTQDHGSVTAALAQVNGQWRGQGGKFPLSPSQIVDIAAGDPIVIAQAAEDLCGVKMPANTGRIVVSPSTPPTTCVAQLLSEAADKALDAEAQATTSLGMLGDFIRALGKVSGRKVVVLVSAGTPVSDRPGGRPDIADLPAELGREAAQSNTTIYTLYIDHSLLSQNMAENRRGFGGGVSQSRDSAVLSHWLDVFSGSAGGVMLTDMLAGGEVAYDRILSETSAYYLLGVEPTDADRDGRAHELKVKVDRKGVTLRSRAWAVIPKKSPSNN